MRVIVEMATNYRVASIIKLNGFGVSVIQRLCKTSVKKNLYWEVKDKVIEETMDGFRAQKQKRRVKVFGLDSTKDVRARLIEILMERVKYHKDKFVAPILHNEMRSMEIKKNGKVEHSDKTHDDQVFSYLMALYVWYDGKNLIENFHLRKTTIKTDESRDIEELNIEDSLEKKEKVDIQSATYEVDNEIAKDLDWVEKDMNNFKTTRSESERMYLDNIDKRNTIIKNNKQIQENIQNETGVISLSYTSNIDTEYTEIPDSLFVDDDNDQSIIDEDYYSNNPNSRHSVLQGNLASFYDMV